MSDMTTTGIPETPGEDESSRPVSNFSMMVVVVARKLNEPCTLADGMSLGHEEKCLFIKEVASFKWTLLDSPNVVKNSLNFDAISAGSVNVTPSTMIAFGDLLIESDFFNFTESV